MPQKLRFPYSSIDNEPTSLMPRLSISLGLNNRVVDVVGLLDTGSSVNLLPYPIGVALGGVWEEQTTIVPLMGALGRFEARGFAAFFAHPQLTNNKPIRLVFAWSKSPGAPVIFGQMNFFLEFDVCFFRSQGVFEIQQK